MRITRKHKVRDDNESQTTPLIDVVFQLLIFFLLGARFIALEEQLSSNLPRDRRPSESWSIVDPALTFSLKWRDEKPRGSVRCFTEEYLPPKGGGAEDLHEFGVVDYSGPVPYGPGGDVVDFGYGVPDLTEIENYVRYRSEAHPNALGSGKGLPVTLRFEDTVPCQIVVAILDICKRVGIQRFAIAASENDYD